MLLCTLSLQEPATVSERTKHAEVLAGMPVMVVCGRQDILSLVLITSVALFPQALTLELSTCAIHQGLALIQSSQPQVLVCIEPLVEEDTLALISQAKRLPTAPKILLICNRSDSQLSEETMEAYCDGILGTNAADAGTIFQALRVILRGGVYRNPAMANGPQQVPAVAKPRRSYSLTAREQEVLQLIIQGHSNREISEKLHLGVSTVKTHVGQLLDKLGARDRTQAAIQAIALGLAPLPSANHAAL